MIQIHFTSEGVTAKVPKGTTILEAARGTNVLIESPCNAAGTCGKCKVKVRKSDLKNVDFQDKGLTEKELSDGIVLACHAKVMDDIDVISIEKNQNKTMKIISKGQSFDVELDGYIKKRVQDGVTKVFAGKNLICEESGNTINETFGIVVDIGTTTLVASIVHLDSAKELISRSTLNPQSLVAQDVLSRIKIASDEQGLEKMYTSIIQEINGLIDEMCENTGVSQNNIYEVVFSGNTTMIHLAANVNPYSLGQYPYTPELKGGCHIPAEKLGLHVSPYGLVYFPPIISAYVGPDITSGVLASRLQYENGVTLFVDIGTNGEMVICSAGELSATSTAAGPAFEGMNITCGMRAANGAVEYFEITDHDEVEIGTIGDAEAVGICGSGLLDIVGELVDHGVIDKKGKFAKPDNESLSDALRSRITSYNGKPAFMISGSVVITQKDIRQVQLAKGAVRAGVEFLMISRNVNALGVDKVLIAGSFGYHLREKSLINIGLLPRDFEGKINFVGNTSQSGGTAFLLNKACREEMESLVKKIQVVELSNFKDFDKIFVENLTF
jgi:uncharacterized 2Fe-2S/4Fe-4S cluster protein (DUF4445 family)